MSSRQSVRCLFISPNNNLGYSRTKSVLVVGAGSIGRRHLGNLRELGLTRLAACDPAPESIAHVELNFGVECFSNFETALEKFQPEAVLVCTPPVMHVTQAIRALRSGAGVFIEKPVSNSLEDVSELQLEAMKRNATVRVGYNLRFHPGIRALKNLVDEGAAGRILWVRAETGQYLPDWRPWQNYRDSYTARRDLGGGIILDASHEINYILWLLGPPRELVCMAGRVSELAVNVEDCATILMRLNSGAQADIHLDFVQRCQSRSCTVAGDEATLQWNFARNEVSVLRPNGPVEHVAFNFETNEMYLAELEDFLSDSPGSAASRNSLAESKLTLEIALASLASSEQKKWVTFGD